jgi:tripartite-type tricarboxylate transporter receptor subunit TctC
MLNALLTPVPFDPLKGFTPVIELAGNEIFVMVNADKFKFRTPQGFIDWAKENGNKAYYGLPNSGGGGQMVAELINKRAGVSLQPVVYKGSAPMMTDLLGGQIGLVVETFATVKPFLESGKIKIIACCSSTRSQFQPDVPTLAETVLPGFDLPAWFGILAPPNTPRQIVDRYNREINEVLKDTAVIDSFARYGTRVTGGTTEAFERFLTETHGLYKQIISEAKLAPG